jgi:multidrug efflux pump subunit AcrA (membrane-fusion protein)
MYQEYDKLDKKADKLFFVLSALFIVFVAWLFIGELDIRVKGYGNVAPSINRQVVEAGSSGVITKIYKKEGEFVKKGEAIYLLDPTAMKATKEQVQDELDALNSELVRLTQESKRDFLEIKELDKEKISKKYYEIENSLYLKNQKMVKQKLKTVLKKIEAKSKEVLEKKAEIKKLYKQIRPVKKQTVMVKKLVDQQAYSKV